MPAAGHSQQTTEYAWRDEAPLPATLTYYRLRQVDHDGSEEVLPVLALEACGGAVELVVLPNPTDGRVEVRWAAEGATARITELRLLDTQGRRLRIERVAKEVSATLDLSDLAAGTYMLVGFDAAGGQVGHARTVRQ